MAKQNNRFIKDERLRFLNDSFKQDVPFKLESYQPLIEDYKTKSQIKSSHFFYDALVKKEPAKKPRIGYFCNMVPEELIRAFGAEPIRLCSADYVASQRGEEIVSNDICPVIKSIAGLFYNHTYEEFDLIVVPSTCDSKTKLAEIISPIKEIYFIDLPKENDYLKNIDIWVEKYKHFYRFLEKRYKKKISREQLLSACELSNKQTEIFRKIYKFRLKHPHIINSFDYFVLAQTSFFMDPYSWIENSEKIYQEAYEISHENHTQFKGPRILLSGAPLLFPNYKLLEIVEDIGADISADTLCSAYGRLYDPIMIDENTEDGIIRALSLKYIAATMCPCCLSIDKLINYLLDTITDSSLNGVIYYNLRLCQVFEIQTGIIRHILKKKKIPFLALKTDLGREDIGQLRTRIEAFLEILR